MGPQKKTGDKMNATIRRAHEIRKEAAARFGGRPGDYSLKIACEMAKNERKVKVAEKQEYRIKKADGKIKYAGTGIDSWHTISQARSKVEVEKGEKIYWYPDLSGTDRPIEIL